MLVRYYVKNHIKISRWQTDVRSYGTYWEWTVLVSSNKKEFIALWNSKCSCCCFSWPSVASKLMPSRCSSTVGETIYFEAKIFQWHTHTHDSKCVVPIIMTNSLLTLFNATSLLSGELTQQRPGQNLSFVKANLNAPTKDSFNIYTFDKTYFDVRTYTMNQNTRTHNQHWRFNRLET